jgi:hypothetical protein
MSKDQNGLQLLNILYFSEKSGIDEKSISLITMK